jgi:hypothetical protein
MNDEQIIELARQFTNAPSSELMLPFARALLAASAPNPSDKQEAVCELCNGVSKIGFPGQRCFACDGTGKSKFAPPAQSAEQDRIDAERYTMDQMRDYALAFHESRVLAERKQEPVAWIDAQTLRGFVNPQNCNKEQRVSIRRADAVHCSDVPLFTHPTPDDASDAARYRWLRNEHFPTSDNPPLAQVAWKCGSNRRGSEWANLIDGNDLDAAIDAAMKEQKESGE